MAVTAVRRASTQPSAVQASAEGPAMHFYYPAEGFGCLYHRAMLNEFFTSLIRRSQIESVAEAPLDSYGIVGAGSLIFGSLRRNLTLVSEDTALLERSAALMRFNGVADVTYLHSQLDCLPVPTDRFDLVWSYERMQAVAKPMDVLRELCRASKAVMIVIPNAYNYGQYAHYLYHRANATTCDYVGPKAFTRGAELRQALRSCGMAIVEDGMIDIPWWPLFPELPNLVRSAFGKASVTIDPAAHPEDNPQVIASDNVPELKKRITRAAVIERARAVPSFVKLWFAHSVYALACKPDYRNRLGL